MTRFVRTFELPHLRNSTERITAACEVDLDAMLTELVLQARMRKDKSASAFDGRVVVKILGTEMRDK